MARRVVGRKGLKLWRVERQRRRLLHPRFFLHCSEHLGCPCLPLLTNLLSIKDGVAETVDAVQLEAGLLLAVGDEADHGGFFSWGALPAHDDREVVLGLWERIG